MSSDDPVAAAWGDSSATEGSYPDRGTSRAEPGPPAPHLSGTSRAPAAGVEPEDLWAILEAHPDGVLLLDEQGTVLFANPEAQRLLGHDAPDLIGQVLGRPVAKGGRTLLGLHHGTEGGPRVEASIAQVPWDGDETFICSLRDVTARLEAQERLEEATHRLETLAAATAEGVLLVDGRTILDANEQGATMFGYDRGTILDADPLDLIAEGDLERIARRFAGNRGSPVELRGCRADGSSFWMEVRVSAVHHDGREVLQAVVRDIERHKRLEAILRRFAHTASHDLKEPLRTITSFAGLLRRNHGEELSPAARDLIEEIEASGGRLSTMIQDLLQDAEAGGHALELVPVDSEEVLQQAVRALRSRLADGRARVVTHELPPIMAARTQVYQLFLNLIGNALKHGGDEVEIQVSGHQQDDGMVRFTVADDGPGVDPEDRERIFEAFRRGGRADPDGSGIGLATCRAVVHRHGGQIALDPTDQGTSVSFTLPSQRG